MRIDRRPFDERVGGGPSVVWGGVGGVGSGERGDVAGGGPGGESVRFVFADGLR